MFFSAALGFAVMVVAYIRVALWLQTSYRQTYHIRVTLLQAVLRQEIGWFDTHDPGELGTRLAESVLTILSRPINAVTDNALTNTPCEAKRDGCCI